MSATRVVNPAETGIPNLMPVHNGTRHLDRALRLIHVGIHSNLNGNAGDTLLFQVVRDLVGHAAGPVEWELRQVWEALDQSEAKELSRRSDGIVVGGGGLLLRDQVGSDTSRSGWQWNASVEAIRSLSVPLAVVAIGYNRFRGQPDFEPPFVAHLEAVAERATPFALRNSGSIEAVRSYLPLHLRDRPQLLHCPTTVLTQVYGLEPRPRIGSPILGVNFALDRPQLRFGDQQDVWLTRLAAAFAVLQGNGWRVRVLRHKSMDAAAEAFLDDAGVVYETFDLSSTTPAGVVAAYEGLDVVAGMRGHGQLVPFGMQIPIVSVVSHNKLAWFLDDIGHPEWGVELALPDVVDRLVAAVEAAATNERKATVQHLQAQVWHRSLDTVRRMVAALLTTALDEPKI
jgi:polysaccharide pyruvyl transferase WcaK-like protein